LPVHLPHLRYYAPGCTVYAWVTVYARTFVAVRYAVHFTHAVTTLYAVCCDTLPFGLRALLVVYIRLCGLRRTALHTYTALHTTTPFCYIPVTRITPFQRLRPFTTAHGLRCSSFPMTFNYAQLVRWVNDTTFYITSCYGYALRVTFTDRLDRAATLRCGWILDVTVWFIPSAVDPLRLPGS